MGEKEKTDTPHFHVSDRRFWVENESKLEAASAPQAKYPSFIEELKARTEAAEQKLTEKITKLDAENAAYRERLDRQLEKRVLQEKADFIKSLLEVIDNFERALKSDVQDDDKSLRDGVELIYKQFLTLLEKKGVKPINIENKKFDPRFHQAFATAPSPDVEEALIDEEFQKGYTLHERLLRPALVKVLVPEKEKE